jgi:Uncharacterised nucleotidyltransferase
LPSRVWPSPNQELLLRATFGPDPDANAAWESLREAIDIDRLEEGSYALIPLLYRRLEAWEVEEPLTPRLKSVYRHTWYRSNLLLDRLVEVLGLARSNDVPVLICGAPRLLAHTYRDPGLRPSSHIELLVGSTDRPRLAKALLGSGWRPTDATGRARTAWFEHADAPPVALEHPDDLDEKPVEIELKGSAYPATEATTELLRICIGPARRFVWNRLQWIADATVLLRSEGGEVDWERALRLARGQRGTLTFRDALLYARNLADAPVPDEVIHDITSMRPTTREAITQRLGRFDRERLPAGVRHAIRRLIPAR